MCIGPPGYRRIVVAPRPSTMIDWARASVETRLGEVSVNWRLSGSDLHVDLVVPYGAEAVFDLPVTETSTVELNGQAFAGQVVGPGEHRIVVSSVLVANPDAMVSAP